MLSICELSPLCAPERVAPPGAALLALPLPNFLGRVGVGSPCGVSPDPKRGLGGFCRWHGVGAQAVLECDQRLRPGLGETVDVFRRYVSWGVDAETAVWKATAAGSVAA